MNKNSDTDGIVEAALKKYREGATDTNDGLLRYVIATYVTTLCAQIEGNAKTIEHLSNEVERLKQDSEMLDWVFKECIIHPLDDFTYIIDLDSREYLKRYMLSRKGK